MIDDDEDVLLAAKMLLKKYNYQVIIEKNPNKIPFLLNNDTYDVILLDMNFSMDTTSGKEGFEWLGKIKMVLQCAALFAIFVALYEQNDFYFMWARDICIWGMLLATALSGLQY